MSIHFPPPMIPFIPPSSPTLLPIPSCATCKKPLDNPAFKNCKPCRAIHTERWKRQQERKRERERQRIALLQAEFSSIPLSIPWANQENARTPGPPPPKKAKVDGEVPSGEVPDLKVKGKRKKKVVSARTVSESSRSSSPSPHVPTQAAKPPLEAPQLSSYHPDPDEYQDAQSAFHALREQHHRTTLQYPPSKLNFRLTYAIVAEPAIDNHERIALVAKSLREVSWLKLSFNPHLVLPGSSPYARPHSICERWRCKCALGPGGARVEKYGVTVSALANWDGAMDGADKCGGWIYISSEYDASHVVPGVRGQRVVVTIVHPDSAT